MKTRLSLVLFVLIMFAAAWGVSATGDAGAAEPLTNDMIAKAIIDREKKATEAWKAKDKAFWSDYLADDATYFSAMSPYLETSPKENFLPKFEQYVEMFKIVDSQMYNTRVQVYGDVAILTYNNAATVNMGGQTMNYTGKVTAVYAKQGNTWRVVHGHETMNPSTR